MFGKRKACFYPLFLTVCKNKAFCLPEGHYYLCTDMFRAKLLTLFIVVVPAFAVLASGTLRRPHDNISIWYLYMNDSLLTNSQLWNMHDTAAFITLKTAQFSKQDTVRFTMSFDVFGLRYHTYLYLGTAGGQKELVSEQVTDNVAAGRFAASTLQEAASRFHSPVLQLFCRVDNWAAVRLINLKLE